MLREYQTESIRLIRECYARGNKKAILWLPTGSGKSCIACDIIKSAVLLGRRVIFAVKGISLINQISNRLFAENVRHGVHQANHWNRRPGAPVQVVSIDTIVRRKDYPPADLIIVDEADQAVSESYTKFLAHYPNAFILGITATPFSHRSLKHVGDEIIHPIGVRELTEQGYLVPLRYFAPSAPNLRGVRIDSKSQDFENQELEIRMGNLTGDILTHWKRIGEGRPTLCFGVNIHHSRTLTQMFNDNGVPAVHIDASSRLTEREVAFRRLESGEIKIICNVGITTRGIDLPFVSCLIMARPTHSYNLYIQSLGRGTRICPGKSDCLILDHASNTIRHGFMINEPPAVLEGSTSGGGAGRPVVRICGVCFLAYDSPSCPVCGPLAKPVRQVEVDEGSLEEVNQLDQDPILAYISHCKRVALQRGYKQAWIWHQVVKRFGMVEEYLPNWFRAHREKDDPFFTSPFRGVSR